ncbi:hypothetical protein AGMMS50256_05870 [Betaproteobacteria bacterium]|nr:hypothetical protein AGMMS50256_05870 [Betaproteobacteria bacterium]
MSEEDKFYEIALLEVKANKLVHSIHARALVESNGDKSKIAPCYIRLRVENLQRAAANKITPQPQQAEAEDVPVANEKQTAPQVHKAEPEAKNIPIVDKKIPSIEKIDVIETGAESEEEPCPWKRFFAKFIDQFVYFLFLVFVIVIFKIDLSSINPLLLPIPFVLIIQIVDGVVLHLFGSSIGRLLFNIHVSPPSDGDISLAIKRSLLCFVRGMGLGIPVVSLFFIAYQHGKLKKNKQTSWDMETGYSVSYGDVGFIRMAAAVSLIVLTLMFVGTMDLVGKSVQKSEQQRSQSPREFSGNQQPWEKDGAKQSASLSDAPESRKTESSKNADEQVANPFSDPEYGKPEFQKNADEQFRLGLMYSNGNGVEKNDVEAAKYFRMAAEQGHAVAQNSLGWMFENGQGVAQNYAEAVNWYRKAAEQGFAAAQNNLGWIFQNGFGVTQNDAEAVNWYRKAAEQGFAGAQNNLGYMFHEGRGVMRNYSESIKWVRKAAEQGDADAQTNLGWAYFHAEGVTRNYAEAVNWYRKAAAQGHEPAIKELQRIGAH